MGNVVIDMSMSLDGYIAAPNDTPEQGLGEDGMRLHNWAFDDPSVFEEVFGNLIEDTGAVIMGRRSYDNSIENWGGKGPLGEVPCFVVTHRAIEGADPMFTVVPDGIESALAKAREAARRRARGRDQDPPGRCLARRRPSVVRRAPQADRAGTDRGQPDGRCDASRVPRRRVALPAVHGGYTRERLSCTWLLHLIGSFGCASPSDFLCR
jgi:dihydrofolate reductase